MKKNCESINDGDVNDDKKRKRKEDRGKINEDESVTYHALANL